MHASRFIVLYPRESGMRKKVDGGESRGREGQGRRWRRKRRRRAPL